MRRYAIDARSLFSAPSGIPLYTRRLIEHMGRHLAEDEELVLYLPTPIRPGSRVWKTWRRMRSAYPTIGKVRCSGSIWALWLHSLLESRLKLKLLPVDMRSVLGEIGVFHATNHEMPRCKRACRIVTMYDLAALRHPELHNRLQLKRARFYGSMCRDAAAVICISEATRGDVVELLGIPHAKTHVVFPACGNECEPMDKAAIVEMRERYRIPERYILYMGTIEPRKNLVRLILAFAMAVKKGGLPHHLVLAGRRGWMSEGIYREAGVSLVRERIRFLGEVREMDVAAVMSGADLFVFPSLMEGFGIPVLEAMRCGVPVVTSNVSSIPEVTGNAAVLVDPSDVADIANGVLCVLTNDAYAEELRKRGVTRSKHFSWDRTARQTLDVYRLVGNQ